MYIERAPQLTWQPEAPEKLPEGLHEYQVRKVMQLNKRLKYSYMQKYMKKSLK